MSATFSFTGAWPLPRRFASIGMLTARLVPLPGPGIMQFLRDPRPLSDNRLENNPTLICEKGNPQNSMNSSKNALHFSRALSHAASPPKRS
jgi:hypothetical protein